MFDSFTVSGASLPLLNVGERGVISSLTDTDANAMQNLKALGLDRGTPIQVVKRLPNMVVKTEEGEITLSKQLSCAIYVRTNFFERC